MEISFKTKIKNLIDEYLVERKAMFIPIACVSAFMMVGYAAVDKEKPEIITNEVELPYGEKLNLDAIEITDNRDSRDLINVEVAEGSVDTTQLGNNTVEVKATDQFSNEARKTITVKVVDQMAPEFEVKGAGEGYAVEVPVYGSTDITSYVGAKDNVDGDVTPFIESDKELDTSKLGSQAIKLSVTDSSGNVNEQTYEFSVSDTQAPKADLIKGTDVELDYGKEFKLEDYVTLTDNYDKKLDVKVDSKLDNKKEEKQEVKVFAKDTSGNETEVVLQVTVKDISGPELLLSQGEVTINAGDAFDAKSYVSSVIDNKDGDIISNLQYNTIDTSVAGTQTVTFSATDAAGNTSQADLVVTVNGATIVDESGNEISGANPMGSGSASDALSYVLAQQGGNYLWGGTGNGGYDCSGLIYAAFGGSVPRTSQAQAGVGQFVSKDSLQPGDIVFYSYGPGGGNEHVGMYVGGGRVVHASNESRGIANDPLDMFGSLYYTGARRY